MIRTPFSKQPMGMNQSAASIGFDGEYRFLNVAFGFRLVLNTEFLIP